MTYITHAADCPRLDDWVVYARAAAPVPKVCTCDGAARMAELVRTAIRLYLQRSERSDEFLAAIAPFEPTPEEDGLLRLNLPRAPA